jgi:cell division septum initiation protein DivIVA
MSDGSFLNETLNRRARTLAYLRPLFDIEANKGRYPDLPLDGLDLFRFASAVLDAIVTEMGGFRRGATFAQIVAATLPQLRLALPELAAMEGGRIVGFLIDQLTNERERESFRIRYQCTTKEGGIEWALAIFKLVELVDSDDGHPRYVAKPEAINIYLESLGVELEAQQVAADAALQHFIRHGKLDEAALAARDALARTIGYFEHIRRALRLAERSVENVDWVSSVQPQLKHARDHIEERLLAEDSLAAEAERKMAETDQAGREKLVFVKEQLEAVARKHNELLTLVIGAGRTFLDEHARQSFRPMALAPFPDPQNAVLKPLLQRPVGETDVWLSVSWHLLFPPRIAPIADLALVVGRLWQERRVTESASEITAPELEAMEEPAPAFAEAVKTRTEAAFDALSSGTRLSDWLAKLDATDGDARQLAVLLAGQWFEGSEDEITVTADGRQLAEADAYGDDLCITRNGHA